VRGSLTSSVFGDVEASAVTLKFVPPIAKVVEYTFGAVLVMFLVIPPAVRRVAPSLVGANVWTRDSSASQRLQAAGCLAVGTTRNSIDVLCVNAGADTIPTKRTESTAATAALLVIRIAHSQVDAKSTVQKAH